MQLKAYFIVVFIVKKMPGKQNEIAFEKIQAFSGAKTHDERLKGK